MKKVCGAFLVLVVCSGCKKEERALEAIAISQDTSLELSAITLNLRYENKEDAGNRHWSERVADVVGMLRDRKPDILGIQEGLHGQVADLWASMSDYDFYGKGRKDGDKKGEYAGIFYLRDRFEKNEDKSGMIWLSDTPRKPGSMSWGNNYPRVATWLCLNDRTSGRLFWVINMHLDHKNQSSREKGVRLMVEKLVMMNVAGDPVIWMGDFNAMESNPALKFLVGKTSSIARVEGFDGLVDTFQIKNAGVKERGTLHFWMNDPNRQWKVDHIFISKGGEVLNSGILRGKEPYLSDHFPVEARVRFPAENE